MSKFPKAVQDIFEPMKEEITWLHVRWIIYKQLFESSAQRIDLLNECASVFFWIIQGVLIDEVQLGLGKLTDPANTAGKDNLSFCQLQEVIEVHDQNFADNIKTKLAELLSKVKEIRTHRDKRLAHLDLRTAMKDGAQSLPPVTIQTIEDALCSARDYMNAIEEHYCGRTTGYDNFLMSGNDGEALVSLLRYGLRYEELAKEGIISPDDWHKGKWTNS